ncbi:hypothetical protein [Undibacterium terreum]|uniref:Lipoprotein n=1 Tax=Undibacterium terreum TaxID=1224302 RepID=A0A916UEY3_9BURK|nr:hypothetical protein [Undibacterium terreum]GGC68515.1 hypothetical protein GCM10011396_14440 [Undibacterium terreum]
MRLKFAVLFAMPCVLSACAPMPVGDESNDMQEEKVYVTGSNLPQRSRSSNLGKMSEQDLETLRRNQTMTVAPLPK